MGDPAADDVGGNAYAAVLDDLQARHFGTSDADLRHYAEVGGSAGGAAACTALGAGLAAPICAEVGGKIGAAIYDGLKLLTHSGPTAADLQASDVRRADAVVAAGQAARTTAIAQAYATVRTAALQAGKSPTDLDLSRWLSDVADHFKLTHVWPQRDQLEPGPGGHGSSLVHHLFTAAPIAQPQGFGGATPTYAQTLPAVQRQLDDLVADLRTTVTGVLALLAAGAIHVDGEKVVFPMVGKFVLPMQDASSRSSSAPTIVGPTKTEMMVGGAVTGSLLGAGIGAAFGSKHRGRAGAIGAVAGAVVGAAIGAAL